MSLEQIQFAITVAIGVFGPILGYFVHELSSAIKELKNGEREVMKQLADLRADLPVNYVRNDYLQRQLDNILSMLHRIDDKVDNKVDRP